jgi:transposase InsO family protein
MSKRRAVVLAVVVEGSSQAVAARRYELSEATVSRWLAPLARRGRCSVRAEVSTTEELAEAGAGGGCRADREPVRRVGRRRSRRRARHHRLAPRTSPRRGGLDLDDPASAAERRPDHPGAQEAAKDLRFEAAVPNECWQSDFTHWALAEGSGCEILTWLDDHARYALSVTAQRVVTGPAVAETFGKAAGQHGYPASVLTDNAMVYTTRFAGGRGGRNQLETTLAGLGITQKHSRPNHPSTCGKVERFQQTLKRWLAAQRPAAALGELQGQLDAFIELSNHHRPHRSLARRTPAAVYHLLPKASPHGLGAGTHHRVRHDRIDKTGAISLRRAGRMHHIGIGRTHAGRTVLVLIDDLDIRVIDTTTGEVLRHLTLDPTRDYQPHLK